MARVTIEDCLEKLTNIFELSVAAMKRAKSIHSGSPSLSKEKKKPVVSALREIAEDKVVAVKKVSE